MIFLGFSSVWYVQDDLKSDPEQVIFDPNTIFANETGYLSYFEKFSFNGQLVACGFESESSDLTTVRIRNLSSGEDVADILQVSSHSVEWTKDDLGLFYAVKNKNYR